MNAKRAEISMNDIDNQKKIMERLRKSNDKLDRSPLAFVDTYGCQQNEADSEKLRGMLAAMGYGLTADEGSADVIVLNTCAVREHAEMRVYGNVGALVHTKRRNPGQIIALCGLHGAAAQRCRKNQALLPPCGPGLRPSGALAISGASGARHERARPDFLR